MSAGNLSALHRQLCTGDPTAPLRLAEAIFAPLIDAVSATIRASYRRSRLDDDQIESACGQTLATYLADPTRFDPQRGDLLRWLAMDAIGDLRNEAGSAAARRERTDSDVVELRSASRNPLLDEPQTASVEESALDAADPYDLPPAIVDAVRAAVAEYSAEDIAVIELMGQGVRETAAYAAVLGISHLSVEAQQAEVKKCKDRLGRRLERLREQLT